MQRAADLGGGLRAGELLRQGQACLRIATEEAVAIRVDGGRDTVALNQPAEEQEVAMGILLWPKHGGEHGAGGIVDGSMQDQPGATVFEPRVVAAVHLNEQAGLGHPLAAAAMAGWPPGAGTPDPGLAEQPSDGGARKTNRFAFGEELREVAVVAAGIAVSGQREDPNADLLGGSPWGGAATIAMGEGRRAALAHPGQQPMDVPDGMAEHVLPNRK